LGGGPAVEKPDLAGDDFRSVAFAAAVLGFVLASSQSSVDIDLAGFADELDGYAGT